jgi:hypothetical protein
MLVPAYILHTAGRTELFFLWVLILALNVGNIGFLWVSYFIYCLFVSVQHFWIACYICLWLCQYFETSSRSKKLYSAFSRYNKWCTLI